MHVSSYCNDGVCPFANTDVAYYVDDSHVSSAGALLSTAAIADRLK